MDGSMMSRGTCGTCDAYHEVGQRESGLTWGQCREEPPRMFRESARVNDADGNKIGNRPTYVPKFPMVQSGWWCRKWAPAMRVDALINAVRLGDISLNEARREVGVEPVPAEPVQREPETTSVPLTPHDPPRMIYRLNIRGATIVSALDDDTPLAFQGDVEDLRLGTTKPGHYRTNKALGQVQLGSAPCGRIFAAIERPGSR